MKPLSEPLTLQCVHRSHELNSSLPEAVVSSDPPRRAALQLREAERGSEEVVHLVAAHISRYLKSWHNQSNECVSMMYMRYL